MWRSRSLNIQAKCGTFRRDGLCYSQSLLDGKGEAMKKTLMALAAVATLAVAAMAPAPAQAQRGLGAAVAGGIIGGAIVGGAIASQNGYYGPGYGPGYGYYGGGGPAYVDGCGWQRQRFWDGYEWRIRNVRVCY
jgi:hypothetical protein